jgi:hypothetical protein
MGTRKRDHPDLSASGRLRLPMPRAMPVRFADALSRLPLFDDLFLRMQAFNLGLVDEYLNELESKLVRELIDTERTPPGTIFVAALAQLWVFGVYEILRTWRHRSNSILGFAARVKASTPAQCRRLIEDKKCELQRSVGHLSADMRWTQYQRAARDQRFRKRLASSVDRFEFTFRRIEALRVALAKHEMPDDAGGRGIPAMNPGYARIDTLSASIQWQTSLRDTPSGQIEVDVLTRKGIAEDCIKLARVRNYPILPRKVQAKLQNRAPKEAWNSWGVHKVSVTLKDGTEYRNVFVGWYKEVLGLGGQHGIPFDPEDIVDVRL